MQTDWTDKDGNPPWNWWMHEHRWWCFWHIHWLDWVKYR